VIVDHLGKAADRAAAHVALVFGDVSAGGASMRWAAPLNAECRLRWPAALARVRPRHNDAMIGRVLNLVGCAPRVGMSALAQRLLEADGIPWLPTDVVRTVLRRVLPNSTRSTRTRSTPGGLPR
jgi:hypothetical protein